MIVLYCGNSCQNREKEKTVYAMRVAELGDIILVQSSVCFNQSKVYSAVWDYVLVTGEDSDSAARHILGSERTEDKEPFTQNKMNIDPF